jgi:hypothetical protein
MSECYYSDCPYHHKDEPICSELICKASDEQLIIYRHQRVELLRTIHTDPDKLNCEIYVSTFVR